MALPEELGNVSVLLDDPSQFLAFGSRDSQTSTLAAVKYLFDLCKCKARPVVLLYLSNFQRLSPKILQDLISWPCYLLCSHLKLLRQGLKLGRMHPLPDPRLFPKPSGTQRL